MKKNLYVMISVVVSLPLIGCGSDTSADEDTAANVNNTTIVSDGTDGGTSSDSSENTAGEETSFALTSNVMQTGSSLPITYTCDGDSISPPLNWSGAPDNTTEYALVMHHIAAPDDVHWYWVMYNMTTDISSLQAGEIQGTLGTNGVNGLNEYAPPCSQGPGIKSYMFTLYALSDTPDLSNSLDVDRDTLLTAITDLTLASVELSVSYERGSTADLTRCQTIQQSVSVSGFNEHVGVTCDDDYAYISADTYPDHDLMNGIIGTNEQIPVPATNYDAPIKLTPQFASVLTTIDAAVGVAINGVPIYDYSSQGELDLYNYNADSDTYVTGQLDNCGGHAGRGDDYHYHVAPTCMITSMMNQGDDAIIGWGYDGYPLYGDNNPDSSEISEGDLDVCNGQIDDDFGYRYHTSTKPPYIIQCLVGEVDTAILPRVAPLTEDSTNSGARANLTPPQGGVDNLTHSIADDGSRTMTYSYSGNDYYVTYSPSSSQDYCYDFEQKTVSSGGNIETGTFCRDEQVDSSQQTELTTFKLEAWSDNWFAAYLGSELIVEDAVSINTERSFNAETATFTGSYPLQLNFILKDYKENDTGLEYIGESNQQMGDGGFIAQITDIVSNTIIAVSNSDWKCEVLHQAPLDKSCANEANPIAGVGACGFYSIEEPDDWKASSFNDAAWQQATEHSEADVSPKDGYDEITWHANAQLIWGTDLETDNTLICRVTISAP
ncbi:YHYH protein [Colwellia psychrerythraea]|uniref:YHYH domain containing protein n=1 Tax=Colwellia psychrerythraea TaxID=28229 RepID=A0A099KT83_COLPS|nr:YHYH protein [Colwellia psychrerythraea]KGJ93979.1 YHYH domain containing protein [Colwellia psychrerythraea]